MLAKIQEHYGFLVTLMEAIGIALSRSVRTFRDRLDILLDAKLLKNKLCALVLIGIGALAASIDADATALVLFLFIAVPIFFSKENWFL